MRHCRLTFCLPIPRKGIETSSGSTAYPLLAPFRLPIPRKGIEILLDTLNSLKEMRTVTRANNVKGGSFLNFIF